MKEGDIVFIKDSFFSTRVKGKIGIYNGLGGINIPLIRVEDNLYSVFEEEMIEIPEEIKDWPVEEIKLFLAL